MASRRPRRERARARSRGRRRFAPRGSRPDAHHRPSGWGGDHDRLANRGNQRANLVSEAGSAASPKTIRAMPRRVEKLRPIPCLCLLFIAVGRAYPPSRKPLTPRKGSPMKLHFHPVSTASRPLCSSAPRRRSRTSPLSSTHDRRAQERGLHEAEPEPDGPGPRGRRLRPHGVLGHPQVSRRQGRLAAYRRTSRSARTSTSVWTGSTRTSTASSPTTSSTRRSSLTTTAPRRRADGDAQLGQGEGGALARHPRQEHDRSHKYLCGDDITIADYFAPRSSPAATSSA